MGRGSATAFHPHCVIYNITDTTTPKFTPRVSWEKEKKKKKREKDIYKLTVNTFSCLSGTVPVSANQEHIHHL